MVYTVAQIVFVATRAAPQLAEALYGFEKYGGSEHLKSFMGFFEDKPIVKGAENPLLWSGIYS